MHGRLAVWILLFISPALKAAEAEVEICSSTTVLFLSNQSAQINGAPEECINISQSSSLDFEDSTIEESESKKERIQFFWGGCNTTGEDLNYEFRHDWRYSITESAGEGETAEAVAVFSQGFNAGTTYTEGSGSFSEIDKGSIENNLCIDGLTGLSASAATSAKFDIESLSDDFGTNGLFVDPANGGNGFDFNFHEFGMTIFYYGHTSTGERLWLISGLFTDDLEYGFVNRVDMYEVKQGNFGQPAGAETKWGTLDFWLNECNSGGAKLNGDDGEVDFSLVRLAGLHGRNCD